MSHTPCPRCGGVRTVAGWADDPGHAASFQPDGVHWLRHLLWHCGESTHVALPDRFRACLARGLVWNRPAADQLSELVGREAATPAAEWEPPPID
jgi:hypothetical protein